MMGNYDASCDRDTRIDNFAAELTCAAYYVALRHGKAGTWVDLELDLWRALTDTVRKWEWSSARSEAAFACDWAASQPDAAHNDGPGSQAQLGNQVPDWRDARLPLSGE
jgi:hypothetical protein